MLTRILAGLVLAALLFAVVLVAPLWVGAVVVGLMAAVASYELLYRTGLLRNVRMNVYSAIMAFAVSLWSFFECSYGIALLGLLIFYLMVFGEMMLSDLKLHVRDAFLCFLGGVLIPFMLTSLVRIITMEYGRILVFIPFILAFGSDIGAYFIGTLFGKHKLCPKISPKKSVEGLVGGVVLTILVMIVFGFIIQAIMEIKVHFIFIAIYGFVGALGGAFGDLCLSVIKRQTGIKDYGNLIPGHGGVLDRFDSVLVTAPLTEALLLLLPMLL